MKNSRLKFALILVIIGIMAFLAICGVYTETWYIPSVTDTDNGIRLGLDLVGGSYMTFEAEPEGELSKDELAAGMSAVIQLLQGRLDTLGYAEATVQKVGDNRVRVEIPSVKNPEEAEQKLGSTAELLFQDSDGKTILTGMQITSASAKYGATQANGASEYFVSVTFDKSAEKAFYDATVAMSTPEKQAAGENYIAITLDGELQSAPRVSGPISGDGCVITGSFDQEGAVWLAYVISSGRLPFALKMIDSSSIGPTLGEKSLETSLMAGAIGVALVMLFMLLYYRLPGLIADISLLFYTLLVAIVLTIAKINLSLPGIAGIILSIGMAVDANVVIFERIREELRTGKTVSSSIKSGFNRAFGAIFDSNITTIIAAVVLKYFGTGPIVGFADTLLIGVIISMFTAIVISKALLTCLADMKLTKLSLYGVKEGK